MRQVSFNQSLSNKSEWNDCFIKNKQVILIDFADFIMQERRKDDFKALISWAWYYGCYHIVAEPIKLHYSVIQFLMNATYTCNCSGTSGSESACPSKFVTSKSVSLLKKTFLLIWATFTQFFFLLFWATFTQFKIHSWHYFHVDPFIHRSKTLLFLHLNWNWLRQYA